ncbi:hypothetical protein CLOP_g24415, partial [Closterium sp. NIES-67]
LTMNEIFRPLLDKCVIIYLDEILVYSTTREQHLKDLEAVFSLLEQNRLITKGSECEFLKHELGHVISIDGVKIDPKKIATIRDWKPLANLRELQIFLGFVNYVHRFIPNKDGVTSPLTDLLMKGTFFEWGGEQQAAFEKLKILLTTHPVLRIVILTVLLLQDFGEGLKPIAYESRKLNQAERNYPIHEKELLAIVHAFKVWRCYLTGVDVTVRTDHKALQFIRAQPTLNPQQIRLLDYLESNFHKRQYGTRLHLSTAYHPQSDGQTERTNQTIEQLLRTTCTDPAQWEDTFSLIEFAYNNAPSATTTWSPFFFIYGIDPTTPLSPPIENPAPRSQHFVT